MILVIKFDSSKQKDINIVLGIGLWRELVQKFKNIPLLF